MRIFDAKDHGNAPSRTLGKRLGTSQEFQVCDAQQGCAQCDTAPLIASFRLNPVAMASLPPLPRTVYWIIRSKQEASQISYSSRVTRTGT